ncbi:hypothetical protein QBC43DRAFT_301253 [Cladorrhinum sp. PSN259]|nr:hypothetical protein QBC43DRAFT_301253 [Cladorrhinum sp. PSN259]
MADPFGIIGIIGVATQITQIAIQFGMDWKDAPADAKSFTAELQSLKTVLSETNMNVILNNDFADAFHGRHSTILSQLGPTAHNTDAQMMVSACRHELDNLLDDLKKQVHGPRVSWERIKGAFLAKKTREAVQNLHRQYEALNKMAAIDAIALSANTHRKVKEIHGVVDKVHDYHVNLEVAEQRSRVLDWITPVDYAPQQSDFIKRRQAGTGQWFLDSIQFKTWVKTENQILFCPGIPGAGKTILTAIAVDDLTTRFETDKSIGIAYIYCNFRQHDQQNAEDLIASLLKQLAQRRPSLPDVVKSLYDKHKNKGMRPSLDEVSQALCTVATTFARIFIIVDALDECQTTGSCRTKFLSELFQLRARCGANLFATSRFIPEISEKFQNSVLLEIRAKEQDVQGYVKANLSHLPSFVGRSLALQEEIMTKIINATDGMFLLANLYLNSLAGKRSPKALRAALSRLPSGSEAYDYAYNEAMERIEGQLSDQEELAKQVLAWITCAKRPLTILELQHALAVEIGQLELDEENLLDVEDIVSVCAGLVTIDEESAIIRLVHYTTQKYFEKTKNVFESGYCPNDDEFEKWLRSNALYNYAARNWGHHAREASSLPQEVLDFLLCDSKLQASIQGIMTGPGDSRFRPYPKKVTALHIAAHFGMRDAVLYLLSSRDPDPKDGWSDTPLCYAARNGHEAIVKMLLYTGQVDVDAKDSRDGHTPLSYAAKNGHEAVVKLLLATDQVDVNSKDIYGYTPLCSAAWNGHEAIVKVLLATEQVDINSKMTDHGRTTLSYAAGGGHEAIVKLLLATGQADIDSKDKSGRTPLSFAAQRNHEGTVKLLLATGKVDLDSKDDEGSTPITYAAAGGHDVIVQLLQRKM